jgi:hypothetical protein
MDYRTSGSDDCSLHEITLNPAQAFLRLSGQEVVASIVSASAAHATEALHTRSAQMLYFHVHQFLYPSAYHMYATEKARVF